MTGVEIYTDDPTVLNSEGELARRVVESWGFDDQLDMVVEELSELIHAIQKWKRNKGSERLVEHVAEEAADVELMLAQLHYMMEHMADRKYIVHLERNRREKRERVVAMLEESDGDE
jgi:NTP pyrophosphatase (non-canonical NTP hydrolase)